MKLQGDDILMVCIYVVDIIYTNSSEALVKEQHDA